MKMKFLVLYALLVGAALFVNLHEDVHVPLNRPFSEFPVAVGDWRMRGESYFSPEVLASLRPTDYLSRRYASNSGIVDLYLGYHDGGPNAGPIHSPRNCLPSGGYLLLNQHKERVETAAGPVEVVFANYAMGDNSILFAYWFQVRGETLTDEYALKAAGMVSSLLYRRRDAAFIRLSASMDGSPEEVKARLVRFVKDFYPVVREFLPS